MALRTLRIEGDPILNKVSHPVKEMTPRLEELIKDMRRIGTSEGGEGPVILVNPVIVGKDGGQTGQEGCLSVPNKVGIVTRPNHVIVEALDENMEPQRLEGEGLLARAFCHELDHLDGKMYTSLVEGDLMEVEPYGEDDEDDED